jgi:hypothetical protein
MHDDIYAAMKAQDPIPFAELPVDAKQAITRGL